MWHENAFVRLEVIPPKKNKSQKSKQIEKLDVD